MHLRCPTYLVMVSLAWASHATAEDAEAHRHFETGMELYQKQQWDAACDEFGKSDRLEPSMKSKFQLGRCNEQRGRYATARYEFIECERLAKAAGDEKRAQVAREHVAEAEKRTPHLLLQVTAPLNDEQVVANGVAIPRDKWDKPLYVDPGKVALDATAPGRHGFHFEVNTSQPGAEINVAVPELVAETSPDGPPPPRYYPRERRGRHDRTYEPGVPMVRRSKGMFGAGIALSAVGGAAIIAGAVLVEVALTSAECVGINFGGGSNGCGNSISPAPGAALIGLGIISLGVGIPLAVVGGRKVPAQPLVSFQPWISPRLQGGALAVSF